jgi:hypothetical protein
MITYYSGGKKMNRICVRAPEYLGCYFLPFEVEPGRQEIRFEDGLFKVDAPNTTELQQKHIYRPLA